ncbi:hypothetical protein [Streptomyces sp. NPDC088707]
MGALTTAVRGHGEATRFLAPPDDFEARNEPYEPRLPVGGHR